MDKIVYGGLVFCPKQFGNNIHLQTDFVEDKKTEFKGFGKLDRNLPYQAVELKHQIAAMLNTNGGKIFLGVANNGVILGGDYSISDKQYLQSFLKNLTTEYKIGGLGLIEDPEFIEIPEIFVQSLVNKPYSKRYLVVLNILPSNLPIFNDKGLISVRDLGGVDQINYHSWQERKNREKNFRKKQEIDIHLRKKQEEHKELKLRNYPKQIIKGRISYAQALMSC